MAAALNVVEPYMSGVGGAGLLLLHLADGNTQVLNFSGNTPAAATPDRLTPETKASGPCAAVIPGNVAGWLEALQRHGTRSAAAAFEPAVQLAREGFPLHPLNVRLIGDALPRLGDEGRRIFGGGPLRIGAILRQPELAESLHRIGQHGAEYFYRGPLARTIAECVASQGGLLTLDDLAGYQPEWQEPAQVRFRGLTVKTTPPNSEGFQILQTLKLLESEDLKALGHNSAAYIHLLSEAMKLATADRIRWGGDPKFHDVPLESLLADDYIARRRQAIDRDKASRSEGERWRGPAAAGVVRPGTIEGLTTHLAAVDGQGKVASITQSLGDAFGSRVFVPGTGIALNNLLFWTEVDPDCPTPNRVAPGKRWSCPMAPAHVFRPGGFWFSIATPGSYGILQTTVQMLLNVVEFDADPQLAVEAPRFRVYEDTRMQIEDRIPAAVCDELTRRGHVLEPVGSYSVFVGGGQAVMIDPESGARLAGADPRRDGYALAF
jgi:gamma-glutamyltranspeptidase/glutathione hydrolase